MDKNYFLFFSDVSFSPKSANSSTMAMMHIIIRTEQLNSTVSILCLPKIFTEL